jgi:hypothetical protein
MSRYQVSRWSAPGTFALLAFARALHVAGTSRLIVITIACALFVAGLAADALDLGAWAKGRGASGTDVSKGSDHGHDGHWWKRDLGYRQRPASLAVICSGVLSYFASQTSSTTAVLLWLVTFALFGYGLWVFVSAPRH